MGPELDDVVRVVERIPVPVTWDDVQARVDVGETVVVPLASPVRHRGGARRWTWAAVALAVVGVGAAVLAPGGGDEDVAIQAPPTTAGTGGPTSQPPSATVTTQPATRTWRGGAVAVWTGTALLVWGGEAGDGERSGRADGFVHDPASGATTAIPPAPIPPRTQPAGVWTGEELLVCCGLALTADESYGTANAAAYDPATGEWRRLAPPPAQATRSYGSAVWTGTEMLVLFGQSGSWAEPATGEPLALAYDPAADSWRSLASPPADLAREPTALWTGTTVLVWSPDSHGTDRGYEYDPAADAWAELPPADRATRGASAAWTGTELVVWGLHAEDSSRSTGSSWRPGVDAWTALPDLPTPPIEYYNGTPGSQALAVDDLTGTVVLWPTHGYEWGPQNPVIPLFAYDPAGATWTELGTAQLGYHPQLVAGDGRVFVPDETAPVVADLPG